MEGKKKKEEVACRFFYLRIEGMRGERWERSERRMLRVEASPSRSVTLLGTLSRRGSWYIAPLQWNMQAFYVLIIPPPCSADLPPGKTAKAPRSALCQQAVIRLSRARSRDEVPHLCRSELELIVLSSSCRSQMHKGAS